MTRRHGRALHRAIRRAHLRRQFLLDCVDIMGGPAKGDGIPLADLDRAAQLWREKFPHHGNAVASLPPRED